MTDPTGARCPGCPHQTFVHGARGGCAADGCDCARDNHGRIVTRKLEPDTTTKCSACDQPLLIAVTNKGRHLPVDPDPIDDGHLILERIQFSPNRLVVHAHRTDEIIPDGTLRYRPHYDSCPSLKYRPNPKSKARREHQSKYPADKERT